MTTLTHLSILAGLGAIPLPEPFARRAQALRRRVCRAALARIDARLIRRNARRAGVTR